MGERFEYRPALLRSKQVFHLDGMVLRGADRSVDLHDVTSAALVDVVFCGFRIRRLDLTSAEGTQSLSLSIARSAPADDPDRTVHRNLCIAVATSLAHVRPDLHVVIGEKGKGRWAYFTIGVLSILGGLGLGVAATLTGVSGDRMAAIALPILLMIFIGVLTIQGNIPWKSPFSAPVSLIAPMLEALDRPV
jgi:hypothetical protein